MDLNPDALRTSPMHVDAVKAIRIALDEPDAIDVTTDDDLLARDVRVQWADGTVVHGIYDKHAEMFAVFVSEPRPGMTNVGDWIGAIDAPWSKNLAEPETTIDAPKARVVATMFIGKHPERRVDVSRQLFERILAATGPFDWFTRTGSVDSSALRKALLQKVPGSRSSRMIDRILVGILPSDWFTTAPSDDSSALRKAIARKIPDGSHDLVSTMRLLALLEGSDWPNTVMVDYHDPELRERVRTLYTEDEEDQLVLDASHYVETHRR